MTTNIISATRRLLLLPAVCVTTARAQNAPDSTLRYAGRTVDIRPYVRDHSIVRYVARAEAPGLFAIVRSGGALHMLMLPADSLIGSTLNPARTLNVFPGIDLARRYASVPRQRRAHVHSPRRHGER